MSPTLLFPREVPRQSTQGCFITFVEPLSAPKSVKNALIISLNQTPLSNKKGKQAMRIYDAGDKGTAFQGRIIISREFFDPATKDFIHIEAHETEMEGQFTVAFWVPDGNDGGHGVRWLAAPCCAVCAGLYTPGWLR